MPRISLRCKLNTFSGLSESVSFLRHVQLLSKFFSLCGYFWMSYSSMPGSQKGNKREKPRKQKCHWPFQSPGSHFSQRRRSLYKWGAVQKQWPLPLCLQLCDQMQSVIKVHTLNIWRIRSYLPIQAPASCVQAAPRTYAHLLAMGPRVGEWVATTVLTAELTKINKFTFQAFP